MTSANDELALLSLDGSDYVFYTTMGNRGQRSSLHPKRRILECFEAGSPHVKAQPAWT